MMISSIWTITEVSDHSAICRKESYQTWNSENASEGPWQRQVLGACFKPYNIFFFLICRYTEVYKDLQNPPVVPYIHHQQVRH